MRHGLIEPGTDRFQRLGTILEATAQQGSLNRATTALGISYRQAWELVRRAEEQFGEPLLSRRVGGPQGGGTDLTDAGYKVLARYRQIRAEVEHLSASASPADLPNSVLAATTIGPVEVGLMDALEAGFHKATGLWVRHIAAGSGQAMDLARSGRADLVLSHAPAEEERFLAEGWGLTRLPLMTNDFLLCGPTGDPARVREAGSAEQAMRRIAEGTTPFLSRGDGSGTHLKEQQLWAMATIQPQGPWYQVYERGAQGSGLTLRAADELGAYTLVDRATFAAVSPARLTALLDGGPSLQNWFSILLLNPARFPRLNHGGARQFAEWAVGPEGQAIIAASGGFRPISPALPDNRCPTAEIR